MGTFPSVLRSAFWGVHHSDGNGHFAQSEKIWARLRWLGVGLWWYCLSPSGSFVLQPAANLLFAFGLGYCAFTHYLAYRLHHGHPTGVPVPLLDTAVVTLLCAVSGGLDSHAFPYFYGISLAIGVRFGWPAGLAMAALQTLFAVELFFFVPRPEPQLAAVGWQLGYLFLVGGLSGALSSQAPQSAPAKPALPLPTATERMWAVNRALTSLDVDTVMQQLVDTLVELLPCRGVGLVVLNRRSEQAERIATAGGFPMPAPAHLSASLKEGGLLRQACDTGTLVFDTPHTLQTHLQPAALQKMAEQNLLVAPIMHLDYPQPLGCLLVTDHLDGFSEEAIHFLIAVAEQTAVSLENAHLFEVLQQDEVQLRGLLHALIGAQEEERKRLVEDWQTRLGEKLFAVLQDFRRSKDLFLQRIPEAKEQLDRLTAEIDTMAATVRGFTDELHPSALENFGFVAALQEYVAKLRENALFHVTVQAQEPLPPLPSSANLTLFRITQEALDNINKHAQARNVEIAFSQEHKGVSLMIKDDGQGFNPEQHPTGQYGLLYMRERAQACGGTLRVSSARGCGTEVRVNVPIV